MERTHWDSAGDTKPQVDAADMECTPMGSAGQLATKARAFSLPNLRMLDWKKQFNRHSQAMKVKFKSLTNWTDQSLVPGQLSRPPD